ncbi:MAG: ArsA family ATPase [Desulfobacteraceae bacterium]|nr:ArsA family ATPase [Desulfobacteraceae bacterium]
MSPETGNSKNLLQDRDLQLVLFGGKGGVGKTTCATAAALYMAGDRPHDSFLLVSTDPAHSLADAFDGFALPSNLEILELDAQEKFSTFKDCHYEKLQEIASRGTFLEDTEIRRFLDLSLPGLDEIMAFFEISERVENQQYACIIADTAPTGHTLRLLEMPGLMRKWLYALDTLLAKHRYMKQLFAGSYKPDSLDEFLLGLSDSVSRVKTLLQDPARCCFVPVTVAESLSVEETLMLVQNLSQLEIPVSDIICNRIHPDDGCTSCKWERSRQINELNRLAAELPAYSLWGLPLQKEEIQGRQHLERLWENIFPLQIQLPAAGAPARENTGKDEREKWIEGAGAPLASEMKLIIFAGKGGVGKTTLASATAIRFAQEFEDKKIFLFSTDPAHSLSFCLDTPIGSRPRKTGAGFTAMEIDAQKEFDKLKKEYEKELESFLISISPHLDLSFDREVMERLLDLSPPGLDEVMALSRAMEFVAAGSYDVFIFDSAPTGHLIRLLETPEIIDEWLKAFFDLFIKYKHIFRLPRFSQALVKLSKELKILRNLLNDPKHSALYAVSAMSDLAFQETRDLIAACEQMGIHIPLLFLNMATPENDCSFCSALRDKEKLIQERFKDLFPAISQMTIYRRSELRGLRQLEDLGKAMYAGRKGNID